NQLAVLNRKISQLTESIQQKDINLAELKKSLNLTTVQSTAIDETSRALKQQLKETTEQLEKMKAQNKVNNDVQNQLVSAQSQISQLTGQLEQKQSILNELQSKLVDSDSHSKHIIDDFPIR
ncbi:hypothetical protein INF70_22000, partial [Enterobacter cloacae complex sp. P4RS]|uniref:hypothetical protein n=1 Tax=Enterobacter cloacae complex sp. P4RS TaxID=2779590 RepID=UPI0018749A40